MMDPKRGPQTSQRIETQYKPIARVGTHTPLGSRHNKTTSQGDNGFYWRKGDQNGDPTPSRQSSRNDWLYKEEEERQL